MKPKNFPERKNQRRKNALKYLLSGHGPVEEAIVTNLLAKISETSLRNVRTKKRRDFK